MSKLSVPILPVWTLAQMAYKMLLRELLIRAIEDPNTEWDDMVLDICDRIFGYSTE